MSIIIYCKIWVIQIIVNDGVIEYTLNGISQYLTSLQHFFSIFNPKGRNL